MKSIIQKGDWAALERYARPIREAVFVEEQGVSAELEHDGRDETLKHVVVFSGKIPAATGRLDVQGKIGRVAVLPPYRRSGMGSRVMEVLESMALDQGLQKVVVHAQTAVIPFYLKMGYQISGEEFVEADIPHQRMVKILK